MSASPAARHLILRATETVALHLKAERERALAGHPGHMNAVVRLTLDLDLEHITVIALRTLMDGMNRPRRLTSAAAAIGHAVFAEKALADWAKENPTSLRNLTRHFEGSSEAHHFRALRALVARSGADLPLPPLEDRFKVGAYLSHQIAKVTGFFEIVRRIEGRNDSPEYIEPTSRLIAWVQKFNGQLAETLPVFGPLVVPPKKWRKLVKGGFHFACANRVPFIANSRDRDMDKALQRMADPPVFDAINALQDAEWRINKAILGVATQMVAQGRAEWPGVGTVREHDIPEHPKLGPDPATWSPQDKTRHDAWRLRAAALHTENAAIRRKALRVARTLGVAHQYANEKTIWFACGFDFRGRIYYQSPALSPQGTDLQRALLEWSEGAEIDTLDYPASGAFARHGAARWGNGVEKLCLREVHEWAEARLPDHLSYARDPLRNDGWTRAEDPWQFLAWCFAWQDIEAGLPLRLPLQIDGTCNGYQHLAALSGDEALALAVNCAALPEDEDPKESIPRDLYMEVAGRMKARLSSAKGALAEIVAQTTRKLVKRPIMTIPYGAMVVSVADAIEEDLGLTKGDPVQRKAVYDYAKALFDALDEMFPNAGTLKGWLRELTSATNKVGADMQWRTPSGFPVVQRYRKLQRKRVDFHLPDRVRVRNHLATETEATDARMALQGTAPNVLQSLDAAHLHLVAATYGWLEIGAIHDCILFRADGAEAIAKALRREFAELHREASTAMLRRMHMDAEKVGLTPLPCAPERGPYRPSSAASNPHFFS